MPSIRKKETATGKLFYEIRVSRGRGKSYLTKRWYPPDGWSQKAIDRELAKVAAEFERKASCGEIISKSEQKEKDLFQKQEAAKLKTIRQYTEGVFMPTKEAVLSPNAVASYWGIVRNHVFPVLGDFLLVDVSPAMIQNLLVNFQKNHAHASAVKLYNILNGIFQMAFLDYSVKENPMLRVKRPSPRKDEKTADESDKAFGVDELRHILQCLSNEPLKWQVFVLLLADTGMRRGEAVALRWEDISWGTETIRNCLEITCEIWIVFSAGSFVVKA